MIISALDKILEKKNITLWRLKEDTGITMATLRLYAGRVKDTKTGKVRHPTSFDASVLEKLCSYLGVGISELLIPIGVTQIPADRAQRKK